MRKESKYQNRNSSSTSRRLRASVRATRGCARSGASQSHSVTLNPCRMLCIVVVSYRLEVMKDLTSIEGLAASQVGRSAKKGNTRSLISLRFFLQPHTILGMTASVTSTA